MSDNTETRLQELAAEEDAHLQTVPRLMTLEFTPVISPELVAEALETTENFQLPEDIRADQKRERGEYLREMFSYCIAGCVLGLILLIASAFLPSGIEAVFRLGGFFFLAVSPVWFLVGFLLHLQPPKQSKPEECFSEFLSNLWPPLADREKSYRVLAPTTKSRLSIYTFESGWEEMLASLQSSVATQDKATCAVCGKQEEGLWSSSISSWATGEFLLQDEYLRRTQDFLHCKGCDFVYCADCYLQLANRRQCRGCGMTLHGVGLKILMVGAQIQFGALLGTPKVLFQEEDRLASLCCPGILASECTPPWETEHKSVKVGEKGRLACRFHNTGVRIGDKWYVLSGDPGRMLEAERLAA